MKRSERQAYRDKKNGRYSRTYRCEGCGKNPRCKTTDGRIIDYFSDDRVNGAFYGKGLILCSKCADSIAKLQDHEAIEKLRFDQMGTPYKVSFEAIQGA